MKLHNPVPFLFAVLAFGSEIVRTESVQAAFELRAARVKEAPITQDSTHIQLHAQAKQVDLLDKTTQRNSAGLNFCASSSPSRPDASNLTIFQLLSSSKHTTILAEYIKQDHQLLNTLNDTEAVHTVFAPVDDVLKAIPDQKKLIGFLLRYHISPLFLPLRRLLFTRTVPTLARAEGLCKHVFCPARLRIGTNGVIHSITAVLMPPLDILEYLDLNPTQFSTFDLALERSGLHRRFTEVKNKPVGGTWFVPSNSAWRNLDQAVISFLFSPQGRPYLRLTLEYHIVPYWTLFSDGIYPLQEDGEEGLFSTASPGGRIQIKLPTLRPDYTMLIDLSGNGRSSEIRINTYDVVCQPDIFANDAVLHIVDNVLFPPHKLRLPDRGSITVQDIKDIWAEYV